MARGNVLRVVVIAVILGILAVVLSFVAYSKRIKVEEVRTSSDGKSCEYPSSTAFAIGIVAAICLLAEQIVISVGTGCYCCRGNPCPSKCAGITSLIIFVFSWLTFVLAFTTLLGSAILNNSSYLAATPNPAGTIHKEVKGNTDNHCSNIGYDNVFIGAAIWSIISIVLGLISFIVLKSCSNGNNGHRNYHGHERGGGNFANEEGVAMGQPMTTTPAKGPGLY